VNWSNNDLRYRLLEPEFLCIGLVFKTDNLFLVVSLFLPILTTISRNSMTRFHAFSRYSYCFVCRRYVVLVHRIVSLNFVFSLYACKVISGLSDFL
jgi:hypothetical protein